MKQERWVHAPAQLLIRPLGKYSSTYSCARAPYTSIRLTAPSEHIRAGTWMHVACVPSSCTPIRLLSDRKKTLAHISAEQLAFHSMSDQVGVPGRCVAPSLLVDRPMALRARRFLKICRWLNVQSINSSTSLWFASTGASPS